MGQRCMNPDCLDRENQFIELAKRYNELKKKTFDTEAWKGKDVISIQRNKERKIWTIVSHQKDRDTGKVKELSHDVPDEYVTVMREALFVMFIEYNENLIKGKGKIAKHLKNWLIKKYQLDFRNEKEFFGSRKEYFAKYYHPLVILKHFGLVEYESSGNIILTSHFFEQRNNTELVMWNKTQTEMINNGAKEKN